MEGEWREDRGCADVARLHPQYHQPLGYRRPRNGNVVQRVLRPQPPRYFLRAGGEIGLENKN